MTEMTWLEIIRKKQLDNIDYDHPDYPRNYDFNFPGMKIPLTKDSLRGIPCTMCGESNYNIYDDKAVVFYDPSWECINCGAWWNDRGELYIDNRGIGYVTPKELEEENEEEPNEIIESQKEEPDWKQWDNRDW
tara:strand:+ start:259 stop:657 length:399 start_codon:yes stop_codon:yes gene_type:complete